MQLQTVLFNKVSGLWLRINVVTVKFLCSILRPLSWLFKKKNPSFDVLMFPHAFKGNTGFSLRFEQFFPILEEHGIKYTILSDSTDNEVFEVSNSQSTVPYNLLKVRFLWSRFSWVLKSGNYSCIYIQRGLLPLYYDLKIPFLEIFLKNINPNIVIDFWDAIWLRQPELINNTALCAKVLTVSNEYLKEYFDKIHSDVRIQPIVRDVSMYKAKTSYKAVNNIPILVWTGQTANLKPLEELEPIFSKVYQTHPFLLRLIGKSKFESNNFSVEHHYWDEATFYTLLNTSDIGIYVQYDTPYTRGKSAMKIIDYMSTGLPVIASPFGAPTGAQEGSELLYAISHDDWEEQLKKLIESQNIREQLGKNALNYIASHYTLSKGFEVLETIIKGFRKS